jgi:hypothetical protein
MENYNRAEAVLAKATRVRERAEAAIADLERRESKLE